MCVEREMYSYTHLKPKKIGRQHVKEMPIGFKKYTVIIPIIKIDKLFYNHAFVTTKVSLYCLIPDLLLTIT